MNPPAKHQACLVSLQGLRQREKMEALKAEVYIFKDNAVVTSMI